MQVVIYYSAESAASGQARQFLQELRGEFDFTLIEIDLEQEPDLRREYQHKAPVVKVGPYTLESPLTKLDLQVAFGAAGKATSSETAGEPDRPWARRVNRGLYFLSRHWLTVFSVLVLAYGGMPFVAPTLMKLGATGAARVIYTAYSPFCHQLAFRSWFLFGEQPAYPRELAGLDLKGFEQATGLSELDFVSARRYLGDEQIGYKVALCQRDIAIYAGILVAGLLFGLVRARLKPLPLAYWFILGILPIALDGGSQLVSQIGLLSIPARESTPLLRTLSGGLFGMVNVWMAYPHVDASMRETRLALASKLAVAGRVQGVD
ncbi:MAG: DUF2085 domain-containing protein [Anaerolineales bacterium]